ncbi:MAG: LysR family transcriptional regulator [Proteobacteria bacterium]|uniref:LysR family transcriptional regulator n=1 Tax=Aquabacterium sp. TaxID=1872578 RepID=UPI0035C68967|nr:LysR family transcriptional regulator [Pseudomonadota bacterium]
MDQLYAMTVFVTVVDEGGFASAARRLNVSPPVVTRAIADLEEHLQVRLLTRTTRVVRVTEAGARYALDCRRLLADIKEADEAAQGMHGAPRGDLTLTAPVRFGNMHVMPIVADYLRTYPEVNASCWFVDRVMNMVEEGVDVAVRIGDLPDSSLHAIRVGTVRRVVCASPGYLEAHGIPLHPQDLGRHTVISATGITASAQWRFMVDGQPRSYELQPRIATNSNESAITAALSGFGLTRLMSYQVADHLRAGTLKLLLTGFEHAPLPVHVVYQEGRQASQKVRTFLDVMVERLRANTALN